MHLTDVCVDRRARVRHHSLSESTDLQMMGQTFRLSGTLYHQPLNKPCSSKELQRSERVNCMLRSLHWEMIGGRHHEDIDGLTACITDNINHKHPPSLLA